ncbi:MAG: hypothetical protein E7550_04470 [Ruminococcaceae bacterium]|nr:hypothetical protein [Oscillospiraceae bacterium]
MKDKKTRISGSKIVTLLLVAVFLVYFIHQMISIFMPLTTGTAVYYEAFDGINTTGTIVRNETLLASDAQGVKYFVVGDGEKVSKDGVIADIYETQEQAQKRTDLKNLEKQIESISEVQAYNNTSAIDLDLLNGKIDEALLSLMTSCRNGVYTDSEVKTQELLKLLNRKKIAIGEEADFSAALASLKSSYESLKASAPVAKNSIKSTLSGYFVSTADGYEEVLTAQNILSLTPEKMAALEPGEVSQHIVGKIVSDYTWYVACTVPLEKSAAFKVGDTVKLRTTLKSATEITSTVAAINLGSDSDALMVFACQNMNGDLATVRTLPLTIVTGEYEGLRVSNQAVRVVGGKTGVYVISGMQAKFVEIEIIRTVGEFTLCKPNEDSSASGLRLYDEVIEKGRNIYDGKIIR